jgi:asparagine synthase (glutamine-hydrolysing)
MVELMAHEPHYHSGTFAGESPGVAAGFAVLEGSFADCLPIRNEAGDIVLFLTGECYGAGKASYLVHRYEEEGESFFGRLNGWYSGLLIDRRTGTSYLFNDRCGMRRIYVHEASDGLFFSSEAKSLLGLFPETRTIDPRGLGEYLRYGSIFANRTLFAGISILPPSSVWRYDGRSLDKRSLIDPAELEGRPALPASDFLARLEETFLALLPGYLVDGRKCLALTGGLDTRMILACAKAQPGELPCLTHGGMYKEMLDVSIAREVAEACGQSHCVIPLGRDFLSGFPTTAEQTIYMTDGLADVLQSHQLYLNRIIRDLYNVKITGKYGSQVIKRISAFHRPTGYGSDDSLVSPDFRGYLEAAEASFREQDRGHPLSQMIFKEIPWWWGGILSIEFSQLTVRSPYLDNAFIDLMYRSPFERIDAVEFQLGIIGRQRPGLDRIMTDAGHGGGGNPITRAAKYRYYRLVNIIERAYARDKLPHSWHHPVALIDKRVLSPLGIPRLFLGLSDYRHYRTWTRDELADYIQSVLLDGRTLSRPFWNRSYLERAVKDHMAGRRNRLTEVNKALSLELVHRTLVENPDLRREPARPS